MTEDRHDEIDEVLSKYLPSKGSAGGERPSGPSGRGGDADESNEGADEADRDDAQGVPGELTDGMFAWVKANLIFIFLAGFLALSLVTIID